MCKANKFLFQIEICMRKVNDISNYNFSCLAKKNFGNIVITIALFNKTHKEHKIEHLSSHKCTNLGHQPNQILTK